MTTAVASLLTVPLADRLQWTPAEIARYSRQAALASAEAGIAIPDTVFQIDVPGATAEEKYLRASDPRFWRRAATRIVRIAQEKAELLSGEIGAGRAYRYSGASAQVWDLFKKKATANFLASTVVYSHTGNFSVPLEKLVTTLEAKAARLYTFSKGLESLATSAGLRWAMLTITLPPQWHPAPVSKKTASTWNGETADKAHAVISEGWKRIRAILAKQKISLSGIRTEEPMKDSTPHWHIAFFFNGDAELKAVMRAVLLQFPAGLRIRSGVPTRSGKLRLVSHQYRSLADFDAGKSHSHVTEGAQCQIDVGTAKTGNAADDKQVSSFASYILNLNFA
jgi:hypothetical protein